MIDMRIQVDLAQYKVLHMTFELTKGQLISKAIYGILDSPKKQTKKI